ncbi:hypothetical protein NHX12_027519 [Muraenolepis orangiensis]|uniref:Uncharacterized protein n=1 Tax=Muraenolepis orangiensis TaxID=630683 RepID=A0A9Q0IPB1_9TELE|nr:hypothetical protein NHX12_027519 [Muraenolepis orangiensis]
MTTKGGIRADEGLLMMQELEDRLQEQIDKLEHVRLASTELKDSFSESNGDLSQAITDHLDWLNHLSERMDNLQMNTTIFAQMNPKPRTWGGGKQGSRSYPHRGRGHLADDAQSETGWAPMRSRRDSDAASEASYHW